MLTETARRVNCTSRLSRVAEQLGWGEPEDCGEERERHAEEKFVEGLLTRGEAAARDEEGELPPDTTHEIVEEREGELPKVRRDKFTIS